MKDLTDRELEVLELEDKGRTRDEIASELCIQRSTVNNHVTSILIKLNASNIKAALYNYRNGLKGLDV